MSVPAGTTRSPLLGKTLPLLMLALVAGHYLIDQSEKAPDDVRWRAFVQSRSETIAQCNSAFLSPLKILESLQKAPLAVEREKEAMAASLYSILPTPPAVYVESSRWTKEQFQYSNDEASAMEFVIAEFKQDCQAFGEEVRAAYGYALKELSITQNPNQGEFVRIVRQHVQANPKEFAQSYRFWPAITKPVEETAMSGQSQA